MSRRAMWITAAALVGAVMVGCTAETAEVTPAASATPTADSKPAESQVEKFKAFVAENGTAGEREAMKHVIKVQGADDMNDILDSASVYTDLKGGLVGPDSGTGKLIASAFADWRSSKNGLVTVYGEDGDLIATGNF